MLLLPCKFRFLIKLTKSNCVEIIIRNSFLFFIASVKNEITKFEYNLKVRIYLFNLLFYNFQVHCYDVYVCKDRQRQGVCDRLESLIVKIQ